MRRLFLTIAVVATGIVLAGCGDRVHHVEMVATELPSPPIEPRPGALGVWTGEEMIVFGGGTATGEKRSWADGAAYGREADSWRVLAPFPHPAATPSAIAWTGEEMIVVALEGEQPSRSRMVAAAYGPTSDTWRSVAAPGGGTTSDSAPTSDSSAAIHTEPGPSVTSVDGRVFLVADATLLSWRAGDDSWIDPHGSDERLRGYSRGSSPVHNDGLVYQGLANRDDGRHGLATIDASTGELIAIDELDLPGDLARDVVGPLHPVFDGDDLLLLGVESIGSEPRMATVLAEGDAGWEIVAQTDDEHFAGIGPGGYKALIVGGDALYSLHANDEAGVFLLADRSFAVLDLAEVDRCALGDGAVWTGESLLGWNGGHCRDEPVSEFQPEADRAVMVTPRS